MFKCKWNGCERTYAVFDHLVEHVNEHISAAIPEPVKLNKPIHDSPGKEPIRSAKNLELAKDEEEIDLLSTTSGEEDTFHETNQMEVILSEEEENEDDVKCDLCGSGKEYERNLIVLCDGCDLGYHQKCHPTFIPDSLLKAEESIWYCYLCEPASSSKRPNI